MDISVFGCQADDDRKAPFLLSIAAKRGCSARLIIHVMFCFCLAGSRLASQALSAGCPLPTPCHSLESTAMATARASSLTTCIRLMLPIPRHLYAFRVPA